MSEIPSTPDSGALRAGLFLLVLLGGAIWLRLRGERASRAASSAAAVVLPRRGVSLSPRHHLAVVEFDGREHLIALGPAGCALIASAAPRSDPLNSAAPGESSLPTAAPRQSSLSSAAPRQSSLSSAAPQQWFLSAASRHWFLSAAPRLGGG